MDVVRKGCEFNNTNSMTGGFSFFKLTNDEYIPNILSLIKILLFHVGVIKKINPLEVR